jgi:DNA uptake protein ComE-like DNA-binding protein
MMMVVAVMAGALHCLKANGNPLRMSNLSLPRAGRRADNGPVQASIRLASCAFLLLVICAAGTAQNQDRDTPGVPGTSANAPPPEARIDINHATVNELLKVPGMTPSWAGRIVRFRPYRTKDDLLERGVVTSKVYDHIKDYVIAHRDKQ